MVQLYTANHTTTTGISDLVKVIVLAGESHDVNVEVNNEISSQVVLFIDEFSCRSELKRLLKIKKDRNVNYVLISSEFETDSTCGPSFNEFSKQNKVTALYIAPESTYIMLKFLDISFAIELLPQEEYPSIAIFISLCFIFQKYLDLL